MDICICLKNNIQFNNSVQKFIYLLFGYLDMIYEYDIYYGHENIIGSFYFIIFIFFVI